MKTERQLLKEYINYILDTHKLLETEQDPTFKKNNLIQMVKDANKDQLSTIYQKLEENINSNRKSKRMAIIDYINNNYDDNSDFIEESVHYGYSKNLKSSLTEALRDDIKNLSDKYKDILWYPISYTRVRNWAGPNSYKSKYHKQFNAKLKKGLFNQELGIDIATDTLEQMDQELSNFLERYKEGLNESSDPGYGLSKDELIKRIKKLKPNYNTDKSQKQLYHIYNYLVAHPDTDEEYFNSDQYIKDMEQAEQDKKHPLYSTSKSGDKYIRTDNGGYEKVNESINLNEANLKDLIDDSKRTDPKRIELAKSLYTAYKGVDSDGTLLFETDSQTRSGLVHKQRIFYPGFFKLLDKVDQNEKITDEDVVDILTSDLYIDCTCESFLYWAWAYKSWRRDYGLKKELREPKRNNVNLNGGACKHVLSMLELINRSDSLFDKIANDLNNLFQEYKKQPHNTNPEPPVEEPVVEPETQEEVKKDYTPVDDTQFARTAANLARKGKTNKKLHRNPKAAAYNIPVNQGN